MCAPPLPLQQLPKVPPGDVLLLLAKSGSKASPTDAGSGDLCASRSGACLWGRIPSAAAARTCNFGSSSADPAVSFHHIDPHPHLRLRLAICSSVTLVAVALVAFFSDSIGPGASIYTATGRSSPG
mmetsp:Transcript_52258/g.111275  ORF Transcript_52258/g.111275 Transcript_52258/m.111275 type:complete len:126 (+) Transcript_52258:42-419(+)